VYEKNFEKHLKKCNSVVKCLGKEQKQQQQIICINKNIIIFIGISLYIIRKEKKKK
jgi:hypothetical protein